MNLENLNLAKVPLHGTELCMRPRAFKRGPDLYSYTLGKIQESKPLGSPYDGEYAGSEQERYMA